MTRLAPPRYGLRCRGRRMIDPFAGVIDAWLRTEPKICAITIHERLAAPPYNSTGNYKRTKVYVREHRPRILDELGLQAGMPDMHRH